MSRDGILNEITKVGRKCGLGAVESCIDEKEGAVAVRSADVGKTEIVVEVGESKEGCGIIGKVTCF